MIKRAPLMLATAAVAAAGLLAFAAATGGSDLAGRDDRVAASDLDPAATLALHDQIMVDPELSTQSNANAVRPPETPTQAVYPLEEGAGAAGPGTVVGGNDLPCGTLNYGPDWAARLPAAFPVYPGGNVAQAAGTDRPGCRSRIVAFTSKVPARDVLEWYRARAAVSGFSSQHQVREGRHVLSGRRGEDSYYLIVTPGSGVTEVALIAGGGQ